MRYLALSLIGLSLVACEGGQPTSAAPKEPQQATVVSQDNCPVAVSAHCKTLFAFGDFTENTMEIDMGSAYWVRIFVVGNVTDAGNIMFIQTSPDCVTYETQFSIPLGSASPTNPVHIDIGGVDLDDSVRCARIIGDMNYGTVAMLVMEV